MRANRTTRAFTLLELLVTVMLITVLVSVLIPTFAGVRHDAQSIDCLVKLRGLSMATIAYVGDYGSFPFNDPLGTTGRIEVLELGLSDWLCPADRTHAAGTLGSSYAYLAPLYMVPEHGSLDNLAALRPRNAVLTYEANPALPLFRDVWQVHGYRNAAFYDGRAQSLEPEAF
jgi:prepilin-type N-terminal cleavage/methylation domain-containing protein